MSEPLTSMSFLMEGLTHEPDRDDGDVCCRELCYACTASRCPYAPVAVCVCVCVCVFGSKHETRAQCDRRQQTWKTFRLNSNLSPGQVPSPWESGA